MKRPFYCGEQKVLLRPGGFKRYRPEFDYGTGIRYGEVLKKVKENFGKYTSLTVGTAAGG
jgi:hypothetical protein